MPVRKKKSYSARQIIRKEYGKSRNIITPNIVKYGKIRKNKAYEISYGKGFTGGKLYGVSIASINKKGKTKRNYKQSKVFNSQSTAQRYINKLRKRK